MSDTTLGQRIHCARIVAKLTRPALAKLVDASAMTVRNWEIGAYHPSEIRLRRLADVLSTTPDQLLGDDPLPQAAAPPAPTIPLTFAAIADDLRQRAMALRFHPCFSRVLPQRHSDLASLGKSA